MTIGEKIKAARKGCGLTQRQLGERCEPKIHEVQIRKYERGEVTPKLDTIKRIATGMGITPVDLIGPEWFDLQAGPKKLDELREQVGALQAVETAYGEAASDLVASFSELNETGQKKALDYVSDLAEQPKYQK